MMQILLTKMIGNERGAFNLASFILFAIIMLFGIFIAGLIASFLGIDTNSTIGIGIEFTLASIIVYYLWENYLRRRIHTE
jgi:hypothetical protein